MPGFGLLLSNYDGCSCSPHAPPHILTSCREFTPVYRETLPQNKPGPQTLHVSGVQAHYENSLNL